MKFEIKQNGEILFSVEAKSFRFAVEIAVKNGANLSGADLYGAKGVDKNLCTPLTILLDQPGKIRAYKLVTQEGFGPYYPEINYLNGKIFSVEKYDESDNAKLSGERSESA